jgi:hypothetical protein
MDAADTENGDHEQSPIENDPRTRRNIAGTRDNKQEQRKTTLFRLCSAQGMIDKIFHVDAILEFLFPILTPHYP